MKKKVMVKDINGTNETNIILIGLWSTYYVFSCFLLPNVHYVPLTSNIVGIPKHRHFFIGGLISSLCKDISSRTTYHSKTEWVPYQIKLIHLDSCHIPTLNQYCFQQSDWPPNCPHVHRKHSVLKIITLLCSSVFFFCKNKAWKPKKIVIWKSGIWNQP